MARGLSLVAILHVVASLESLRGGEERARGLTCRWSWKTSRISKTSVKLNTTEWNFVMVVRGGGLGSYTALPFCLPMLYSRLLPPHGIWVSSDDIQHNTDQPGSHGICRPGAGWADWLKRKTWSSLVHDQPFNLLAGHSLTSDCIFDLVEFRISGWWSDQTWTSLVGSMSTFGQQTSSGCRRWDLKWYSWQSFVFKTGEFCQPWKGGGVGPAWGFGGVEGTRWQDGDQLLDVSLKLIPKTILFVVNLGGIPFFHCPIAWIFKIFIQPALSDPAASRESFLHLWPRALPPWYTGRIYLTEYLPFWWSTIQCPLSVSCFGWNLDVQECPLVLRTPHTNPTTSLQLYRTSPPISPQVVKAQSCASPTREWGKELDNSKLGETLQLWGSPENDWKCLKMSGWKDVGGYFLGVHIPYASSHIGMFYSLNHFSRKLSWNAQTP